MTKKKKEKEIMFNPSDYDYMDDMPFEGWMWEIIRRSEKYIKSFNAFSRSQSDDDLSTVLSTGIIITMLQTENPKNIESHLLFQFNDNFLAFTVKDDSVSNADLKKTKHCFYDNERTFCTIPRPDTKYIDSPDLIKIKGLNSSCNKVVCKTYEELNSHYRTLDGEIYTGANLDLMDELAVFDPNDTLYIGISKKANREEILKQLSAVIRKYLNPSRTKIRDDKWKYYLIAFDLKKQHEDISYEAIADTLHESYPYITITVIKFKKNKDGKKVKTEVKKEIESSAYFNAKNCETFYKNALALINGEYKKYI